MAGQQQQQPQGQDNWMMTRTGPVEDAETVRDRQGNDREREMMIMNDRERQTHQVWQMMGNDPVPTPSPASHCLQGGSMMTRTRTR